MWFPLLNLFAHVPCQLQLFFLFFRYFLVSNFLFVGSGCASQLKRGFRIGVKECFTNTWHRLLTRKESLRTDRGAPVHENGLIQEHRGDPRT